MEGKELKFRHEKPIKPSSKYNNIPLKIADCSSIQA